MIHRATILPIPQFHQGYMLVLYKGFLYSYPTPDRTHWPLKRVQQFCAVYGKILVLNIDDSAKLRISRAFGCFVEKNRMRKVGIIGSIFLFLGYPHAVMPILGLLNLKMMPVLGRLIFSSMDLAVMPCSLMSPS